MIAGLEDISEGDLFINGKRMNDVAPKDRGTAMVFQNYALYPHMTVLENIMFPLTVGEKKISKEEAKKVLRAIKKGYVYAIEHPEEAAEILIKNAPELKDKKDFILESQKYLSKQYASNKDHWGEFDANRWNAFYRWVNENKITKQPLAENTGFSNDYIK